MTDDRDEWIDRLTYRVMQGIARGEGLRGLVSIVFHEGMRWRHAQFDARKQQEKSDD